MAPNQPCWKCRHSGVCKAENEINRLALWAWLEDEGFTCQEQRDDLYQGIEGVFA